jgi:nicotinate-nucleotide adenylyltransferase
MLASADGGQGGIGIFGGMFDPVHVGHLRTAFELLTGCGWSELRFIPCGTPPHRPPAQSSSEFRLQLLRAAVAGEPRFVVDERELRRPGPSYMVDTLASLRAECGAVPLCLALGADAFLGLPAWHRWQRLIELAHIVVVHRPGWQIPAAGALAEFTAERRAAQADDLNRQSAGLVWMQPVTQLEISSSAIRALVASGGDPKFLVPEAVRQIILDSGCYRPRATGAAGHTEVRVRA